MKTKSSAKKRFKVTGSGKIKESMLLKVTSWLKNLKNVN
jgi:ribosomal protein L35